MKRILSLIIVFLFLTGCSIKEKNSLNYEKTATSGVWLSYSELNSMLQSEKGFKAEFSEVLENLSRLKIQNLYIHTRAFCDSLYKSDYFPLMKSVVDYDYDVFDYLLKECHKNSIKVHAWINPYRVLTSSEDIEALDQNSPAYKWLRDDNTVNDRNVCFSNGIYLNPAELEVQRLIIDGIKEILEKYYVDGIHFDDYFYPTTHADFDKISYEQYINDNQSPMALDAWRRNNVNSLISACYNTVKYFDREIIFSVSPSASIEQNYNNLYADVKEWINFGYIDYIIPQLYFGFEYPDSKYRFDNLVNEWKNATKDSTVGLLIGLANYKAVPELENDIEEWQNNDDIISRQVKICKDDEWVQGYVYFSYNSLFSQEIAFTKQRENILKLEN